MLLTICYYHCLLDPIRRSQSLIYHEKELSLLGWLAFYMTNDGFVEVGYPNGDCIDSIS